MGSTAHWKAMELAINLSSQFGIISIGFQCPKRETHWLSLVHMLISPAHSRVQVSFSKGHPKATNIPSHF